MKTLFEKMRDNKQKLVLAAKKRSDRIFREWEEQHRWKRLENELARLGTEAKYEKKRQSFWGL